jgi:hypothetical protein
VRLWRHPLGRALLLGIVLGATGALVGLAVASSRDAALTSGVAWGLYITGALLLFLGSSPSMAPNAAPAGLMPDAARAEVMQRQKTRIAGAPWMLLNFVVAAALIGVGALFEIYG